MTTHLKTLGILLGIVLFLLIFLVLLAITKGLIVVGIIMCFFFVKMYLAIYNYVKETEEEIAREKRMQKGKED